MLALNILLSLSNSFSEKIHNIYDMKIHSYQCLVSGHNFSKNVFQRSFIYLLYKFIWLPILPSILGNRQAQNRTLKKNKQTVGKKTSENYKDARQTSQFRGPQPLGLSPLPGHCLFATGLHERQADSHVHSTQFVELHVHASVSGLSLT